MLLFSNALIDNFHSPILSRIFCDRVFFTRISSTIIPSPRLNMSQMAPCHSHFFAAIFSQPHTMTSFSSLTVSHRSESIHFTFSPTLSCSTIVSDFSFLTSKSTDASLFTLCNRSSLLRALCYSLSQLVQIDLAGSAWVPKVLHFSFKYVLSYRILSEPSDLIFVLQQTFWFTPFLIPLTRAFFFILYHQSIIDIYKLYINCTSRSLFFSGLNETPPP